MLMIIRQTPKDLDNYIKVDSNLNLILHQNNFPPKFIDDGFIYYLKTEELIKFIDSFKR